MVIIVHILKEVIRRVPPLTKFTREYLLESCTKTKKIK